MEWQLTFFLLIGSLILLMATGLPVAFCFIAVNIVGVVVFWGGKVGIEMFILSISKSVATSALVTVPMFILMGEVMFHSGIVPQVIETLDKLLGRLPGRLSLLAVVAGTIMATFTGVSMASVAVLGSLLVPEMEKRGYKKPMTLGPILGSGGLAMMIPPSSLAVLLGALGEISIGDILLAIITPGLLMATIFTTYIITRCKLQRSIAPSYETVAVPFSEKLVAFARNILPTGLVVFLVVGLIFLGIATPNEASATGAVGCFFLTIIYKKFNWKMVKDSLIGSLEVSVMMLLIIVGASCYSQILVSSGATRGMLQFTTGLPLSPLFILIAMQIVVMIMGAFMDCFSMLMITLPVFMPIVHALKFDPVWFAVIMLLNMEVAVISPPFGLSLFAMKGVAPPDTTMGDVYRAALPFIGLDLFAMVLVIAFPEIPLWLPAQMG